ncbi:Na+/H+ antiporter MnhB subunit-related protein [Candidatus Moduliflexus flocculans]|uniref:Na+/H+ antiporter MnhB subunit-related protein n=1 Tax=Candidatus Moduliflexus flocculans TaxID=1499966 RepID=A0A081BNU9_9BACT|nr:Na+/H+ antiporter MnhB subunit-related protein [Candidatus Moduliflexus flocculans]
MKRTDILEVTARKLAPFILLFGCYVIAYGHLSPGGGFQGGVVLASGVILLALCQGVKPIQRLFPSRAVSLAETIGFLCFLVVGIIGLAVSGYFLFNFFPVHDGGTTANAGFIFALNLVIGLKVGAGMTLICFYLLKEE